MLHARVGGVRCKSIDGIGNIRLHRVCDELELTQQQLGICVASVAFVSIWVQFNSDIQIEWHLDRASVGESLSLQYVLYALFL